MISQNLKQSAVTVNKIDPISVAIEFMTGNDKHDG